MTDRRPTRPTPRAERRAVHRAGRRREPPRRRAAPLRCALAAAHQHAHRAAAALPARARRRSPARCCRSAALNPVKVDAVLRRHPHLGAAARPAVAVRRLRLAVVRRDLPAAVRLAGRLPGAAHPAARARAAHAAAGGAAQPARGCRPPTRWTTDRRADAVVDAAAQRCAAARWRTDVRDRGRRRRHCRGREGLPARDRQPVFHVSLVVLLAGIALGGLFGYKGKVLVVEGNGFANAVGSYDIFRAARLSATRQLRAVHLHPRQLQATYQRRRQAAGRFDAQVTLRRRARTRPRRRTTSAVNHPLYVDGSQGLPRRPRLRAAVRCATRRAGRVDDR